MRAQAGVIGIALCALAAACGGGGGGGGGGTGGAAGTGGTGGTGGTAGTGGTTQTSTVEGTVMTYLSEQNAAVSNATVAVMGTSLSAKTDASGAFSIDNVPNGENFFTVKANGYWGTVDYWDVPDETANGFTLYVVTDADVSTVANELGRSLAAADGIVDVYFYPAVTGASATINPPNHDPAFTLDANGRAHVQNTVIAVDGEGDLFFTSVPAGGTISASVQGPAGTTCTVVQSDTGTYPIEPKAISVVYATCQ